MRNKETKLSTTSMKFKSSLSNEQMRNNFVGFDYFDGLREGLTNALAYLKENETTEIFTRKRTIPSIDMVESKSHIP